MEAQLTQVQPEFGLPIGDAPNMRLVPKQALRLPAEQPRLRLDDEVVSRIAADMEENGVNSALVGIPYRDAAGNYEYVEVAGKLMPVVMVVNGSQRTAALQQTSEEWVPVIMLDGETDPATLWERMENENNLRSDPGPLERGLAILGRRLRLSVMQAATQLGELLPTYYTYPTTQHYAEEWLRLQQVAAARGKVIKEANWDVVEGGRLSPTTRKRLVALAESITPAAREELIQSSLSEQQQIAIGQAPAAEQLHLLQAVLAGGDAEDAPVAVVIAAAALCLLQLPHQGISHILDVAEELRGHHRRTSASELATLVVRRLNPAATDPEHSDDEAATELDDSIPATIAVTDEQAESFVAKGRRLRLRLLQADCLALTQTLGEQPPTVSTLEYLQREYDRLVQRVDEKGLKLGEVQARRADIDTEFGINKSERGWLLRLADVSDELATALNRSSLRLPLQSAIPYQPENGRKLRLDEHLAMIAAVEQDERASITTIKLAITVLSVHPDREPLILLRLAADLVAAQPTLSLEELTAHMLAGQAAEPGNVAAGQGDGPDEQTEQRPAAQPTPPLGAAAAPKPPVLTDERMMTDELALLLGRQVEQLQPQGDAVVRRYLDRVSQLVADQYDKLT